MSDELNWVRRLRPEPEIDSALLERERRTLMASIAKAPAANPPRIVPHLIYDDVPRALEWLARAFGFRERAEGRFEEPDGTISHAEMELAGAVIMLGPPSIHGGSPSQGVATMLAVDVDDVDRHCTRAREQGAEIVLEPEDQVWGERRYQARDPEGHQWHFATPLANADSED